MTKMTVYRVGRRSGGSSLVLVLLVLLLAGIGLYVGLDQGLAAWGDTPVRIIIDGEEIVDGLELGTLSAGGKLVLVLVLLSVGVMLALLLPMVMLLVLVVVAFALLVGLGLPLMALAAVLLLVASPLLLLMFAIARLLQRSPRGPKASATIVG
ncbi:hypothetical protein HLB44_22045 [Aquincola sp. S2]|uniref:Uncharacterized protein n=1 Tax=Pseudaquabacterium terrae TaxID=2732868 RepID=A0ABX2EM51_9BURK|nr:hypothetical protein [Aquabacterium terrae]NRF69691.1 hypothetical protein [Aquabacterium terrae]